MPRVFARLVLGCCLAAAVAVARAQLEPDMLSSPRVVFFPPMPPIYGANIEKKAVPPARWFEGRRLSVPDGMADFIGADFYPALSTRLFVPELNRKLEVRLHTYRAKRLQQVHALLNQFVGLDDAPLDEAEQHLAAFAQLQTPQLVALEAEAEQLRLDVINDGLFWGVDWNASRKWRMGAVNTNGDWAEAEAEFQVVRATAYYQKGLVPAQRGLVRELAIELLEVSRKARGLPGQRDEADAMFFSPETARFRLPADLSVEVRQKIGAYNGRKSALKRELRETIATCEGASTSKRAQVFEALADRQWPELKVLEEKADEIRALLRFGMAASPPPPPPWLPAGLMQTIHAYNDDRDLFFSEMKAHADSAVAMMELIAPDPDASAAERLEQARAMAAREADVRREANRGFVDANAERFAQLRQRYKAIREGLTVVAEKQRDRRTGRPLDADTLLKQYGASMEEFATYGRESAIYSHYRIAMFQRGLSPEQRRLLFNYAHQGLAQPLPGGEPLPRRSAKRPYPSW